MGSNEMAVIEQMQREVNGLHEDRRNAYEQIVARYGALPEPKWSLRERAGFRIRGLRQRVALWIAPWVEGE